MYVCYQHHQQGLYPYQYQCNYNVNQQHPNTNLSYPHCSNNPYNIQSTSSSSLDNSFESSSSSSSSGFLLGGTAQSPHLHHPALYQNQSVAPQFFPNNQIQYKVTSPQFSSVVSLPSPSSSHNYPYFTQPSIRQHLYITPQAPVYVSNNLPIQNYNPSPLQPPSHPIRLQQWHPNNIPPIHHPITSNCSDLSKFRRPQQFLPQSQPQHFPNVIRQQNPRSSPSHPYHHSRSHPPIKRGRMSSSNLRHHAQAYEQSSSSYSSTDEDNASSSTSELSPERPTREHRRRPPRLTRLRSTSATPVYGTNGLIESDEAKSTDRPEYSIPVSTPPSRFTSYFRKRTHKKLPDGVRGFDNLGNTCYMNSALQCLVATRLLSEYFYRQMHVKEVQRNIERGSHGALATAFAALVQQLRLQTSTAHQLGMNLSALKAVVSRVNPLFRGYEQHDAQEFLALFLDGIHEEINRANPKFEIADPDIYSAQLLKQGPEFLAASAWQRYLCRNKSFLVDLFQGQLESRITCRYCREISLKFEPFMYLSLPVRVPPNIRIKSLEDALAAFSSPEELNDPVWDCPRCKTKVPVTKSLKLVKLPPVLIIHLKRFEFTHDHRFRKIEGLVDAPIGLDLGFLVRQKEPPIYELYGVVDHSGQAEYGHYTACCCRNNLGCRTWYRFDDAIVTEISSKNVISENNYVLFYERRDVPQDPEYLRRQTLERPQDWPHTLRTESIEEIRKQAETLISKRPQRINS